MKNSVINRVVLTVSVLCVVIGVVALGARFFLAQSPKPINETSDVVSAGVSATYQSPADESDINQNRDESTAIVLEVPLKEKTLVSISMPIPTPCSSGELDKKKLRDYYEVSSNYGNEFFSSGYSCMGNSCTFNVKAESVLPDSIFIWTNESGKCERKEFVLKRDLIKAEKKYESEVEFEFLGSDQPRMAKTEKSRFSDSAASSVNQDVTIYLGYGSNKTDQDEFLYGGRLYQVKYK